VDTVDRHVKEYCPLNAYPNDHSTLGRRQYTGRRLITSVGRHVLLTIRHIRRIGHRVLFISIPIINDIGFITLMYIIGESIGYL
jgi:hypothetical protein